MQRMNLSLLLSTIIPALASAFSNGPRYNIHQQRANQLQMALGIGRGYETKWKKKETLADKSKNLDPQEVGLTGTIPVTFQSGGNEISTLASPGTPIRDVASQAGQFIKYGCGKGECGTCQALCNGKYIKPCVALVPSDLLAGEEYVIQVKETKSKSTSSGKFYSVKSFFMGFYNNLLGMVGFVLTRRAANRNYDERMDYERMIAEKVAAKKAAKDAERNAE